LSSSGIMTYFTTVGQLSRLVTPPHRTSLLQPDYNGMRPPYLSIFSSNRTESASQFSGQLDCVSFFLPDDKHKLEPRNPGTTLIRV